PVTPQTPYMPTPTSQQSFTQPAYTPSGLPSITTAFSQEMLTTPSNEAAIYLQDDDLLPLSMDSLNLPLQVTEAGESNNGEQMSSLAAPLTESMDISTPFTAFAPLVPPVISLATPPPSIKNDPMLGEVMRQAQMGLFVVLGR